MNSGEKPAPQELDTSLGRGMTVYGPYLVKYVVVPPDSELLGEEKVARYDENTVVIASNVSTKPVGGKPDMQTQSIHTFLHEELKAQGIQPQFRETSVTLAELMKRQAREQEQD
jgi:hypothetical protein